MKITEKTLKELGAIYNKKSDLWFMEIGAIGYHIRKSGKGQHVWSFGRSDHGDEMGWLPETDGETIASLMFFIYQVGLELGSSNKLAEIQKALGIK